MKRRRKRREKKRRNRRRRKLQFVLIFDALYSLFIYNFTVRYAFRERFYVLFLTYFNVPVFDMH